MAGYTRRSVAEILNGLDITAPPLNAEFNALVEAFDAAAGHTHDGSTGSAPPIPLETSVTGYLPSANGGIGGKHNLAATAAPALSNDNIQGYAPGSVWLNTVDGRVYRCISNGTGAAVWREELQIESGNKITPKTTNTVDLGSDATRFKSLWLAAALTVGGAATIGGTLAVTGPLTASGGVTGNLTGNVTAATGSSTFNDVTINGAIDVTNTVIKNVSNPVASLDAANKAYVDSAISALVSAAPGTLDTLNELAAALGDDPNFATTVSNDIATKLSKSGGTMTGIITMGGHKITGLGAPVTGSDAVTLDYVTTLYGSTSSAAASAAKADKWANENENVIVESGKYSSKHHAAKAAASAASVQGLETQAQASANAAAASASAAAASYDSFDDRYLGPKATEPTVDNDGQAILTGALFYDTTAKALKIWEGTEWRNIDYITTFPNVNSAVTASDEELNFAVGVTSGIQAQLDDKLSLSGGGKVSGQLSIDTNTNASPLLIARTSNLVRQVMSIGVEDAVVKFRYIEDTSNEGYGVFGEYRFLLAGDSGENDTIAFEIKKDGLVAGGNTVWTAGSDGAGSGLDADLLDGYTQDDLESANTIVRRNGVNDIAVRLVKSSYADAGSIQGGATVLMRVNNTSDNYLRPITGAGFRGWLQGLDGAGSGLDADLLDGLSSNSFLRSDVDTIGQKLTLKNNNAATLIINRDLDTQYSGIQYDTAGLANWLLFANNNASGDLSLQARNYKTDGGFKNTVFNVAWATNVVDFKTNPTVNGSTIWHAGNDGSGSGLDADLLDGLDSSDFVRNTFGLADNVRLQKYIHLHDYDDAYTANTGFRTYVRDGTWFFNANTSETNTVQIAVSGNILRHNGNDGAGSGLDADTLDGLSSAYFQQYLRDDNDIELGYNLSGNRATYIDFHSSDGLDYSSRIIRREGVNGNMEIVNTGTGKLSIDALGGITIEKAGDWDSKGFRLRGNSPSIYFDQADGGENAFIGVNGANFYLLRDSNRNGSFDASPYPFEVSMSGGYGRIFGGTIFHTSNDGSGSGLDADSVDGIAGWQFLRSDAADTATGAITFAGKITFGDGLDVTRYGNTHLSTGANNDNWLTHGVTGATHVRSWNGTSYNTIARIATNQIEFQGKVAMEYYDPWLRINQGNAFTSGIYCGSSLVRTDNAFQVGGSGSTFRVDSGNFTYYGNKIFHAGNDGSGSGLDADFLDGYTLSSGIVANTVALRDGSEDLHCRLVRSDYQDHVSIASTAGIVFRNSTSDNYLRTATGNAFINWINNQFNTQNFLVGTTDVGSGTVSNSKGSVLEAIGQSAYSIDGIPMNLNRISSTGHILRFRHNLNIVGSVSVTSSAASFNTSSDYRLKTAIEPMAGALDRLMALKPKRFEFIREPGKKVDGFIAHEAQEVVPNAVTGMKDAVNEDGTPDYQSLDHSKIVPLLVAALQEANLKIAELTDRVTLLETP